MRVYFSVAALALLGSAASAQPPADIGDGITLEQMRARAVERAESRFAALDTDGNGLLTREELAAARDRGPGRGRARLAQADTDGDGALSLAELQALRPGLTVEQFNRMDANGDGLIGADERPRFRGRPGPGAR